MSSTKLKLIPADRDLVPAADGQLQAVAILEQMIPVGEFEVNVYEKLEFIDCGENLMQVRCPSCETWLDAIGLDDDGSAEWFNCVVDELETRRVEDTSVLVPCCKQPVPFTALTFDWPAGFARFEIGIWDPDVERPMPAPLLERVEEALGCKVLEIWAHY